MVKLTKELVLSRARSRSLEAVKNLNCWGSGFTDVSIVKKMISLEVINASTNNIKGLEAFSNCSNLKELYLRRNTVENLNEILYLKDLTELRVLWLSDNPCCSGISQLKYRMTVLKFLPKLTKLDNIVVTSEEIEKARIEGNDLSEPIPVPAPHDVVIEENAVSNAEDSSSGDFQRHSSTNAAFGSSEKGTRHQLRTSGKQGQQRETLSQTSSINILTAALSLVKELDEESLRMLQDAVQDRLHALNRVEQFNVQDNCDTSCTSSLPNGKSPESKDKREITEMS